MVSSRISLIPRYLWDVPLPNWWIALAPSRKIFSAIVIIIVVIVITTIVFNIIQPYIITIAMKIFWFIHIIFIIPLLNS